MALVMATHAQIERQLTSSLRLASRPVAIAVRQSPPPGVAPFTGSLPSGCSFWKLAADGRTFSTAPQDHYNCPIGSYTHNMPLPAEREPELMQTLSFMSDLGYIRMEEVGGIPRLPQTPGVVIYAPLGETPVEPDAVLVSGPPARLMLLHEAAARLGIAVKPLMGRPTCMAIPAVADQAVVSSLGCIGNRVYTGLPASDLYTTVAGAQIAAVADALATIVKANDALADYHEQRRVALTA